MDKPKLKVINCQMKNMDFSFRLDQTKLLSVPLFFEHTMFKFAGLFVCFFVSNKSKKDFTNCGPHFLWQLKSPKGRFMNGQIRLLSEKSAKV